MLNETWRVWQALQWLPIRTEIETWHPLIHTLPNAERNLLRIKLDYRGHVTSVEDIANDERVGMWRIIKTSDGSFPVIKVNIPLLNLTSASEILDSARKVKKESEQIRLLKDVLQVGKLRTWEEAGWQWNSSLEKAKSIETLAVDAQINSLVSLARSLEKALLDETNFFKEIVQIALLKIQTGQLASIKTITELIMGIGKDKNGKEKKISVLLALDLENDGSVYTKDIRKTLVRILPTNFSSTERVHQHSAASSGFGGEGDLLSEPFPQVKLPVLNSYFPLISMASDGDKAKCQIRYRLTEYTIFPITSMQARQMGGALNWLVTQKEGTTWRGVANGRFEMNPRTKKKKELKDLLIVYVDEKPTLDKKVASLFGAGEEIILDQFEIDVKAVSDALDGIVQEYPKSRLNLFLIREVSDGQIHIVLAESLPVKVVLDSAKRWQQAAKENVPEVKIYLQADERRKDKIIPAVEHARPVPLHPDQVVRLLSYQWLRDGASPKGANGKPQKAKQEIIAPGLGEVLSVMLRTEGKWEISTRNILNLLIRRVSPLIIGLFGAKHSYGFRKSIGQHEPYYDYPRESRETALQAVAIIGILLNSLNISKENYMKEITYLIGQMLSLADTLHYDYCVVVRDGKIPNSLIGTSLMRRALDDPSSALAELAERIIEYVRWAKVVEVSKDWSDKKRIAVNEARKKLRQYQSLSDAIEPSNLPRECNDLMKAKLLLGFLASQPDEGETQTESQKNEQKKEN
jgi:hypothetical protein